MSLIPKMHGATSIWLAGVILGIGSTGHFDLFTWLAILASLFMLFTVQGAHLKFFEGKKPSYLAFISPAMIALLVVTSEASRIVVLLYLPLIVLVYLTRKSFRKYVISGSILLTLPYPLIVSASGAINDFLPFWVLFVLLSLWGVLLADHKIFSSSIIPSLIILVIYTLMLVYVFGIYSVFLISLPLAIQITSSLKSISTKTLGLSLLLAELQFSITLLVFSGIK